MKSFVPPVQITDSLDKRNPSNEPVDNSWIWISVASVTAAITTIAIILITLNRLTWVEHNTLIQQERYGVIWAQYAVLAFPFFVLSFLTYSAGKWFSAKAKKEKAINLLANQGTVDMFDNPEYMAKFMTAFVSQMFNVEGIRAGTITAPNALNYAPSDSHNTSSNANTTTMGNVDSNTPESDEIDMVSMLEHLNK